MVRKGGDGDNQQEKQNIPFQGWRLNGGCLTLGINNKILYSRIDTKEAEAEACDFLVL